MHIYAKKHSQEAITGAQMQDVISFHIESSNEINTQLIQYIVSNLKKKKVSQEDFNATIYFNKLRTQFYDRTYHFLNTLIELRSSPINRIGALAEKIQLTQQRLLEATALYSQATRHTNRQATQHAVSQFRAATRGEDVQDLDASYKKYCETVQTIFSQITECCQQLNFLIL